MSQRAAGDACAALQESLIDPDQHDINLTAVINQYMYSRSQSSTQQYWISSKGGCRAIRVDDWTGSVDCHTRLPVICSQSAPFSNVSYTNTSSNWQTSANVGNKVITGYVAIWNSNK